jgi:hypothetical protein
MPYSNAFSGANIEATVVKEGSTVKLASAGGHSTNTINGESPQSVGAAKIPIATRYPTKPPSRAL